MRRLLATSIASTVLTGTFLVLPVYAAPAPEAEPVQTSSEQVEMGSVDDPADGVDVQSGTSAPVGGVATDSPTLSVTRTAADPFSMVGVTWDEDAAVTDTVVQVRVQDEDGNWGAWTAVTIEDADQDAGADPGAEVRGGTAPLWTGPSTGVEAELVTRSGAQPTDVALDLIDPGTSEADTSLGTPDIQDTADAALSMPDVYSRAQWGADESIRTWDPEYATTIRAATLHHTADTNDYTADQVPAMMRAIYRYHTVSRGWGDIGYNVIADKYGRLWEGRYGGLASTVIGAHAGGFNTGTFGVSMLGNYDTAPTTAPMMDAVSAIIAWKFSLYLVDPTATVRLVSAGGGTSRYAAGVSVTLPTIFGHRDVGSTSCPGQYGYAQLPSVRASVVARLRYETSLIASRYYDDPSLQARLGAPTGPEQQRGDLWWQDYRNGAIYWTARQGARVVEGAILAAYRANGGAPRLGAPTSDEVGLPDGVGRAGMFEISPVYWSPTTGAHAVQGAVLERWQTAGREAGALGYPTSDNRALAGGEVSTFQHGSVYWSSRTGARIVQGGMATAYAALGGPRSPLGFPTGEERPSGGAVVQDFTGGRLIWTASTGANVVWGAIGAQWAAEGGIAGTFGAPTGPERALADRVGRFQVFSGGTYFWSPSSGAYAVTGGVYAAWASVGLQSGPLGYPVGPEYDGPAGSRGQHFQRGQIWWSPGAGAHVVWGAIGGVWTAAGGTRGDLGLPVTGEQVTAGGGRRQDFTGGSVFWHPATGAHALRGQLLARYDGKGGPGSWLGYPTSGMTTFWAGTKATFQHGLISLTTDGKTVVSHG